jgi:hypothetical protein
MRLDRLEIIVMGNKIHLNGKVFEMNDGVLIIEDMTELLPTTYGLMEFERLTTGLIEKQKRLSLLKYLYDNSQAGVKEIQNLLGLNPNVTAKIITIGYETGVFVKKGQWRLVSDIRESVAKYLETMLPKVVEESVSTNMEDFREDTQVKQKPRRK